MPHANHITHIHKRHKRGLKTDARLREQHVASLDKWILYFSVMAPFTNVPQILKIYVEKDAGISLFSWVLYLFFGIPFIVYGVVHKDKVILFNSVINMVMRVIIIGGAIGVGGM